MFPLNRIVCSSVVLFSCLLMPCSGHTEDLSLSVTVQENIVMLKETGSCPRCDLSGADLSRMELPGANLEGANLSRVKFHLSNLSGANLRNSDLREAGFAGADLADIDLRGADLRGTAFAGAYIKGALFDGEMVTITPYSKDKISDVEEMVYVEDTAAVKPVPSTEELTISHRRDFEETPPALPVNLPEVEKKRSENSSQENLAAPIVKKSPFIQQAKVPEEYIKDSTDKEPDAAAQIVNGGEVEIEVKESAISNHETITPEDSKVTDISTPDRGTESTAESNQSGPQKEEIVSDIETVREMVESEKEEEKSIVEEDLESLPEPVKVEALTAVAWNSPEATEKNEVEEEMVTVETAGNQLTQAAAVSVDMEVSRNMERLIDNNQCYACKLTGVDLQGRNLDDADLEGADLRNANLTGVSFEGANLKGVILIGANLQNADLSNADLYKADLTGADLTGAELEGALLDDVVMVGVKGYQQGTSLMVE